jgi:hypothetical protein
MARDNPATNPFARHHDHTFRGQGQRSRCAEAIQRRDLVLTPSERRSRTQARETRSCSQRCHAGHALRTRDIPDGLLGLGSISAGTERLPDGELTEFTERPQLALSVTVWAHTAFPELGADRPYHQPDGDSRP